MERQVGQTRRRRPQRPASSGAVRPEHIAAATAEEGQREPYPIAPHDLTTERYLAGALAGWKHHGTKPDPADFYDPLFGRIARAFIEHPGRIRYRTALELERDTGYITAYTYDGLEEVLGELGDERPRLTAFYAGILAAEAPCTHDGDVARLARLAHVRRRLLELEAERAELAAIAQARR